MELIVIDDNSSDKSAELIADYLRDHELSESEARLVRHKTNQGKGAAIRTSQRYVTGNFVIVQDADLELDPNDINALLKPALQRENAYDIIFGSRFLEQRKQKQQEYSHYWANKLITSIGNLLTGLNLTDLQTCYKLLPAHIFTELTLTENRFAFDPEITMRLAKIKGLRWIEVPITYNPRTVTEGKKLGYIGGFRAIYALIKYRVVSN